MAKTIRLMDKQNQLVQLIHGKPMYADIKCVRMRDGVTYGRTREAGLPVQTTDNRVWKEVG